MEYAYMVAGAVIYFFVAVSEWGTAAAENSKVPFLYAALWPVWLVLYLAILGVMAVTAAVLVFVLFFEEMYKAFKWYREDA